MHRITVANTLIVHRKGRGMQIKCDIHEINYLYEIENLVELITH